MASRKTKPAVDSTPRPRYTLDERRAIFDEGVLVLMPSGVDVLIRPVTPIDLLRSGKIPDTVTPIVMNAIYEPEKAQDALDKFIKETRQSSEEALAMLKTVDVVCEAALVDPAQLPYLTFADRGMIFRMAFLPAEVLSRFRSKSARDVAGMDNGDALRPTAVRNPRRGSRAEQPGALQPQ